VIGPVELVLYIASAARDSDFTGKLVDVFPDGRAISLTDGILCARYCSFSPKLCGAQPHAAHPPRGATAAALIGNAR